MNSLIHQHYIFIGIGLVCTGLLIRTLISKRRFNRRGIAGLQLFSSYWKWLITTRMEALLNLLAALLILSGLLLIAYGWYAQH